MKTFGLIGYPLGHSFSERYFTEKFAREGITDCRYKAFPLEDISMLPDLLHTPGLCGLNVTIPYKQAVIPYLDALDDTAAQIGAVNCIRIKAGRLTGYNTDAYGFRNSLLKLIGEQRPRALVLGSGGASKAVTYVLRELGMDYRVVSRCGGDGRLAYEALTPGVMDTHKLIVNTTPLGTFPAVEGCPDIPYDLLTPGHYLYDVVYNPPVTRFLERGAQKNARTMNGEKMLIGQAERSWEIWSAK